MTTKFSSAVVSAIAFEGANATVAQVEQPARSVRRLLFCATVPRGDSDQHTLGTLRKTMPSRKALGSTLLAQGQYELHQIEAPPVPREEWVQAVRWKLQDQLAYPADEASVDVFEVPRDPNRANEARNLFAVSARNDVIRQRIVDFHAAKLPLSVIDIPELAQRNVAHLYETDARAVGLLVFTDVGALLTFVHGGELLVARHFDVTLGQVMETKGEAFEALMERVALEVQRTYDHVDRRFHYAVVTRVMVCPLPSESGVVEYLSQNLSIKVQQADLAEVMDLSALGLAPDALWQTRNLHVIGAALRADTVAA